LLSLLSLLEFGGIFLSFGGALNRYNFFSLISKGIPLLALSPTLASIKYRPQRLAQSL